MADPRSAGARVVRFGEVEADLRAGEVRRAGRRIALADQPLRILLRLLERPGETVTRDELRRELWADDTFVDFESGLNSAVRRLRDALGDSAERPRYIETLPRRGYRFIAALEDVAGPAAPAPGRTTAPRAPAGPTAGVVLAALLLAGAAAAVGAWLALGVNRSRPPVSDELAGAPSAGTAANLVAVAAFENRTADPTLDTLGLLTADRLIRAISRVETVTVVPEPLRRDPAAAPPGAPGAPPPAPAQAALTVTGAYYLRGDRLEFHARVVDAPSGRLLYSAPPEDCARGEPAGALERIEQAIAGAVAIHFDMSFGGLEITSAPPLLEAYLEYLAGAAIFDRDYARAAAHLERALAVSPGFVLARVLLAMIRDNQGDPERRSAEMDRLARNADRLTTAERLLVEFLGLSMARRPSDALQTLEALEKLAPRSWVVNYSLQMEALILNRPQVAIDAFERLPLDERYLRFNAWRLAALAIALHHLGDHERELAEARRAQGYDPGNLRFLTSEARALAALGRIDELGRVVDRSLSLPSGFRSPGDLMEYAARELRAHGHRDASVAVAGRAIEWYRARLQAPAAADARRAALGRVLYLAGRFDDAKAVFTALAAEDPASVDYTGYLGAIAARQGRDADALAVAARLRGMQASELFGLSLLWRAGIAALLGDRPGAVDLLREALAQGEYLGLRLHQNPDLEPLRGFPPFEDLMRIRTD